jgi:sialate O-acetylesterase
MCGSGTCGSAAVNPIWASHFEARVTERRTLASVEQVRGALRLHFTHSDGGLIFKGPKLEEFSIAGETRKWYWADAHIEGNDVILSSASVPNPQVVRYAWQSNPAATLFNGAGLPAGPFRTDT